MFDVWLLHLMTNSVPRVSETGHNWPPGYLYPIKVSPALSDLRHTASNLQQAGRQSAQAHCGNARQCRAVLCFLGNSQSAIRAATNGKRGRADPANLNTRRGPEVGAGRVLGEGAISGGPGFRSAAAGPCSERLHQRRRTDEG